MGGLTPADIFTHGKGHGTRAAWAADKAARIQTPVPSKDSISVAGSDDAPGNAQGPNPAGRQRF
jgi:hypothetical protein